jgi:membrane-bound lytic murein transglycosylase B
VQAFGRDEFAKIGLLCKWYSMRPLKIALISLGLSVSTLAPFNASPVVQAQTGLDFSSFAQQLGQQALSQGVSQNTVNAVIPTLTLNMRAISLDRAQPGGTPNGPTPKFAPYRATHVDAARIRGGQAKYSALRPLLAKVERETGVPESIMVAIYGHETNYGRVTGNFDLAEALASLAFEGRRRALFTEEFIAVLKLMDRGIPRWKLKGSWAGAMGYPQFLPSMYIRLGVDGDGDGKSDIMTSEADALASIANYFRNAGWRPGQAWGVSARIPEGFSVESYATKTVAPRCPRVHARHSQWKTVAEWRALGVNQAWGRLRDNDLVTLFQPDGRGTPAWLLTGNYRVILEYNCSNFYGMSVGLLADAVES